MSIFRREAEQTSTPEPVRHAAPPRTSNTPKPGPRESTHIASGSKVVGEISGQADLVIDGEVEGEIHLESQVTVGNKGRVEGKIVAGAVQVGGKVQGNVHGLERVEVLASGSLEGDVVSPRVVIAEGAFFKGKVEMTDKASRLPSKPKTDKQQASAQQPPQGSKPGQHQKSPKHGPR